jgi:hypothetical protein
VATVTWGTDGRSVTVRSAAELDVLLDEAASQARSIGKPQDVQVMLEGAGTLGIVVGESWSVLNHVPADFDPPYMVSVGDDQRDELLVFYVAGDHYTETPRRHALPAETARVVMRHYLATGELSPSIGWEEV